MARAFRARLPVSGLELVLVDDVFTTGATLRECARELAVGGAARVRLAVVSKA